MELLKKVFKSVIIGSLTGLAIALFSHFFFQDLIDRLECVTYYMRARWENTYLSRDKLEKLAENNNSVYIIDIDERSMQKLGSYWNWDRSYHAEMIRQASTHFPSAIIFDVLFSNPEDENQRGRIEKLLEKSRRENRSAALPARTREGILHTIDYDRQLVEATREAGNVFHGICLSDENDYNDFALSQVRHKMVMAWHDSLHPASAVMLPPEKMATIRERKSIIDGIFPELARASRAIGHVNIVPNEDGVIRETPLLYRFGDNDPVYFPISVRTIISLFGTPADEIEFEPGKYLDIGKPFKIFKDTAGVFFSSYPGVTAVQVKAICGKAAPILSLGVNQGVDVTSFCAAYRDTAGAVWLEMNQPGSMPPELVTTLLSSPLDQALSLDPGGVMSFGGKVTVERDSAGASWIVRAPYDAEEWWFSRTDFETVSHLTVQDLAPVRPGRRMLLFHPFSVRNRAGELVSGIPVLRGRTLRELCMAGWERIEAMRAGSRMDFGRSLRIPLIEGNRHIITYFGPKAKTFPLFSYYDILHNRVQGELEGKIFLVGSTAPALFDIKAAPHDRNYPAVEIHASLMNSFLSETFVRRLTAWQDFLILLLMATLVGFLSYLFKPLAGGMLTLCSIFGYFLVAMTLFGGDHLWIEIARPVFAILLTFTMVMVYRYVTEEKDRLFLQNTFKQYLSPELIDMMYKQRQQPKLGGDEGIRTAFFTDIQGFSTFSEKLGSPTRLVELLNEYLSEMTAILLKHFGTLDKYEGDAIIAFFGAPMPMDDHAHQACLTALDMQEKLAALRARWKGEGDKWPQIVHEMRMRIGINTGPIVTGNMGSRVRMNYTMMGDSVNLAARLESAAKQYGVYTLVSHFTHDMVKGAFEMRQLDKITVVGKSEPIVIYELLARKGMLNKEMQRLLALYDEGLNYFYNREWDSAIGVMEEADALEPFRRITPKNLTPSKKIIGYCELYKEHPPVPEWDGVITLTSK
ncbi:MAG: CHASE2 domain-containing protein [Chitinispirillaceae bacterium]|nr:CHASE2 domain-containing protein [Chitinispirillaceae bacterium]